MKLNRLILVIPIILFGLSLKAQDMQEGFENLEKGEFAQAESFFKNVLEEYPENKTARLCYARALGLNSNPEKATLLFEELLQDHPEDLEVQLNYAESLLWSKKYDQAKSYYEELVEQHPENFGALLGYANTLSNLKEYEQALSTVNRSLVVSPDNPNAMISRKYIRLGYANNYLQQREYSRALQLLDENLNDFKGDKESLLNKANLYLILKDAEKAEEVYSEIAISLNDSITAYNGISLAKHIAGEEKEALEMANTSLELSQRSTDSLRILEAKERYAQALIWNNQFNKANGYITDLKSEYGNATRVLALDATLGMYTGDFNRSIENYEMILDKDSSSFDGNLGIANAYFAIGEAKKANSAALSTLKYYQNQQDAENFLEKLDKSYTPVLEENLSYSFDNGDNTAVASATGLNFPISPDLTIFGRYTYRETRNKVTDLEANSNQIDLGLSYRFSPTLKLKLDGGFVNASSSQNEYTNLVGTISAQLKPFKRDDLEIGYRRDLQDFNAELLNRQIAGNHLFLNNNYSTSYGLGWYLQYMHTEQSDDNARDLLFTSVYYSFLKKPILKGGFNYQYITFKEQRPTVYFSPEKFQAAEIFLSLTGNDQDSNLFYDLTAATGFQFIEDDPEQGTYRLDGKIGYSISPRFQLSAYGRHSNIASATAAGFTYTEFGLNFRWLLSSGPIFKWNN